MQKVASKRRCFLEASRRRRENSQRIFTWLMFAEDKFATGNFNESATGGYGRLGVSQVCLCLKGRALIIIRSGWVVCAGLMCFTYL